MKKYVAFFDLNKTIIDTDGEFIILNYLYRNKVISLFEFIMTYFSAILYLLKIYNTEKVIKKFAEIFKGMTENEMMVHSKRCFEEELVSTIRQKAKEELDFHKKNGGITVLLSAATHNICRPIKEYLGIDELICTELDQEDGRINGKFKGKFCYGPEKLSQALSYIENNNLKSEDAFFYADSKDDIPLLKEVGNPVCITPGKKLRNKAPLKGWEIREW